MRLPIATIFACALGASFDQPPDAARLVESGKADSVSAGVDDLASRFMRRHHVPVAATDFDLTREAGSAWINLVHYCRES